MRTLELLQGSDEWHAARATRNCASEAPVMMGVGKNTTRNELLRMKATGDSKEFSDWAQRNLLDKGHVVEASARVIFEEILDEELYPTTAVDDTDQFLASFDGVTMGGEIGFEHKLWNEALAQSVGMGVVPESHVWQLEQQILIGGLQKVVFVVSDGTRDKMVWCDYKSERPRRKALLAGWKQFDEDLANYEHVDKVAEPVGAVVPVLPTLDIQLVGEVRTSNLVAYKTQAIAFLENINRDLNTDQDFADADLVVKACKRGEDEIKNVKKRAIGQTASIEELFSSLDEISAKMAATRLELSKLVEREKINKRGQIIRGGTEAIQDHIALLNGRLRGKFMPLIDCDFAGAAKGKRTIDSIQNAVDTELARAKILASECADSIDINLRAIDDVSDDHKHLFDHDLGQLVLQNNEFVTMAVTQRVASFVAAQDRKEAEAKARQDAAVTAALAADEAKRKAQADEIAKKLEAEKLAANIAVDLSVQTGGPIGDLNRPPQSVVLPPKADPVVDYIDESAALRAIDSVAGSVLKRSGANPTDAAIIDAVARSFGVANGVALGWIRNMDLYAAIRSIEEDLDDVA